MSKAIRRGLLNGAMFSTWYLAWIAGQWIFLATR